METDFGTLKADVLTQLACPEGYAYPENAEVDSIALFFRYASWVGDDASPMAINVYELDGDVLNYNRSYTTDIDLSRYCTKTKPILKNKRIIVASEKQDSVMDTNGNYVPMVKMMSDSTSDFSAVLRQSGSSEPKRSLIVSSREFLSRASSVVQRCSIYPILL